MPLAVVAALYDTKEHTSNGVTLVHAASTALVKQCSHLWQLLASQTWNVMYAADLTRQIDTYACT